MTADTSTRTYFIRYQTQWERKLLHQIAYAIRDYEVTITKGTTDKALEVCVQGKAEGLVFVD